MNKLLLSDLTYTATKEFARSRRKLFQLIIVFSVAATYSLVPPKVKTFHQRYPFSFSGYIYIYMYIVI